VILRPCELSEARAFIARLHRHHRPPQGHRFSLKAVVDDATVGVVVIGRPVARHQQDGETVEITRLCTDGTRNAVSFLVGAAKRAARALGYKRMISYTLETEPGASWRASGMEQTGTVEPAPWEHTPGKHNRQPVAPLFGLNSNNDHPIVAKRRWEIRL
jgi:hypothetical protein